MTVYLFILANMAFGTLLAYLLRLSEAVPPPLGNPPASALVLPEGDEIPYGEWSLAKLYLRKREILARIAALRGDERSFGARQQLIRDLQPVCWAIAQREHALDRASLPTALFP